MEVLSPTWDAKLSKYTFVLQFTSGDSSQFLVKGPSIFHEKASPISINDPPVIPDTIRDTIVNSFIEQTKQWFTTPIGNESMKKRLRHVVNSKVLFAEEGWFEPSWKPVVMNVFRNGFELGWNLEEWRATTPKIHADFLMGSQTPRAQSPEQATASAQELRTIQIQDSLIPVGDLPLSDLPPLSFPSELESDAKRQEIRQKIREARLRVALAKLKAERMEHKYYERYGEVPMDSEESSELSSESDSGEEPLGTQTYS